VRRLRSFLVSLLVALGLLVAVEAGLRIVGFQREAAPVVLRFGYPNPRDLADLFLFDRDLFWRLRPGATFDAEAPVPINAAGYRGPLPTSSGPSDLLRVAVLGDSVAFGGAAAWPESLAPRLAAIAAPRPVEILNYGVPGYSIVQGERQYQREVARLAPGVVIIAYGWNDHWLARGGQTDATRRLPGAGAARLSLLLWRLRLTQALHALTSPAEETEDRTTLTAAPPRRVPPDDWRAAVERLAGEATRAGSAVVVLGLPSALVETEFPSYLLDMGFAASAAAAVADHRLYVRLAGEAASTAGAAFLDLQPVFEQPGGEPDLDLFTRDRIHLTPAGHERLALTLLPVLMSLLEARE